MTERRTVFLDSKRGREHAKRLIDSVPDDWVCRVSQRTRTDEQNKALWARIRDLREQLPELAEYSPEQVKLRFMDALGHEMTFLPKLEGVGVFPVGYRSSQLTVEQFGALLTLLDEYGARHGVQWSEAA